jgi:hypothetical protein
MPLDKALGRWIACMVYPYAAWRILRGRDRALLVGTYFAAGYALGLTAFLTIG